MSAPVTVLRGLRASALELAGRPGTGPAEVLRNAPLRASAETAALASVALDAVSPKAGRPSIVRAHGVFAPVEVYGAPVDTVKCRACREPFPKDSVAVLVPGRFGAFLVCVSCGPLVGVENAEVTL